MDERFSDLVENATDGLKDDPELRLAVKSELLDHLEEAARAFAAEGKDEEESVALARQAFGSPLEVAGKLLAANAGRMKLRALARLAVRAVMVPAAVLLAVYLAWGILQQTQNELGFLKIFVDDTRFDNNKAVQIVKGLKDVPALPPLPFQHSLEERSQQFITLRQQGPTVSITQMYYDLWRKHPTSKAYYANYAILLANNFMIVNPSTGELAQISEQEFINQMLVGERLDPDNALYDYLLAGRWLGQAVEVKNKIERQPSAGYTYILRDGPLLERGMREFRIGLHKPFYRSYHLEPLNEEFERLPPARRLDDQMLRMNAIISIELPELARLRHIARVAVFYGNYLQAEGRTAEADEIFAGRDILARQLAQRGGILVDMLVARAIYAIIAKGAAAGYEKSGHLERAALIRRQIDAIQAQTVNYGLGGANPTEGILSLLLPANLAQKYVQESNLAPLAQVEHTALEEASLIVLLFLLLAAMLVYGVIALGWKLALRRQGLKPMLLLPDGKAVIRILVFGITLPIFLYILTVLWLGSTWRSLSITQTGDYTLLIIGLLALALLVLPVVMARRHIRHRCWLLGVLPSAEDHSKRLYRATLTRSLLPIYAAVIIFLGGVFYPYLVNREEHWIKQDRLIFWHGLNVQSLTPLEDRVVVDMKANMLKILADDERESKMKSHLSKNACSRKQAS